MVHYKIALALSVLACLVASSVSLPKPQDNYDSNQSILEQLSGQAPAPQQENDEDDGFSKPLQSLLAAEPALGEYGDEPEPPQELALQVLPAPQPVGIQNLPPIVIIITDILRALNPFRVVCWCCTLRTKILEKIIKTICKIIATIFFIPEHKAVVACLPFIGPIVHFIKMVNKIICRIAKWPPRPLQAASANQNNYS